jgi:predicted AAA+ superfamily ATPase
MTVPDLMERIVVGGWPALLDQPERIARNWLADYLSQIVEVDVPSLGTTRRAPLRLRRTLTSLGRAVGQPIKLTGLAADIGGEEHRPAIETVNGYLDALDRLKLTDNSPSWQPHMRSRTKLREAPVRYFVDPSLGTAALGVGSQDLLADVKAAGFHFEALAIRDLRIYTQPLGGTVSTWRESHGRKEVDAIVETPTGWAAFEVKLTGEQGVIDGAARGLLDFAAEIDQSRHRAPSVLVVVTATGGGGRRADGVHVVPITTLGP